MRYIKDYNALVIGGRFLICALPEQAKAIVAHLIQNIDPFQWHLSRERHDILEYRHSHNHELALVFTFASPLRPLRGIASHQEALFLAFIVSEGILKETIMPMLANGTKLVLSTSWKPALEKIPIWKQLILPVHDHPDVIVWTDDANAPSPPTGPIIEVLPIDWKTTTDILPRTTNLILHNGAELPAWLSQASSESVDESMDVDEDDEEHL